MSAPTPAKMGWNATWSMAVGGMIGGGIFSVLGLVVDEAGALAWLSLLIAGIVALATANSYVRLASFFGEGGGEFTFLRKVGHPAVAGGLSWVLVIGYVLTMSVYAFTFGHYLGEAAGLSPALLRATSVAIIAALMAVNLRGVADASALEIFLVWGKVMVLVLLAVFGLAQWAPGELSHDVHTPGVAGVIVGAAAIFMAYEGFQLLTYDYDDINDPDRTLPRAVLSAVVAVIVIYIVVALGATMLVGADTLVKQQEVGLAIAGQEAWGSVGKIVVSIAAVFSTGSAINATLFATARLTKKIADDCELPPVAAHVNDHAVPDRAVIVLAALAALLAAIGALAALVEAASLTFLGTFVAVNLVALLRLNGVPRAIAAFGAVGAAVGALVLAIRLATDDPLVLALLLGLILVAAVGRPLVMRRNWA
jgi:amino acid transporter